MHTFLLSAVNRCQCKQVTEPVHGASPTCVAYRARCPHPHCPLQSAPPLESGALQGTILPCRPWRNGLVRGRLGSVAPRVQSDSRIHRVDCGGHVTWWRWRELYARREHTIERQDVRACATATGWLGGPCAYARLLQQGRGGDAPVSSVKSGVRVLLCLHVCVTPAVRCATVEKNANS